MSNYKIINGLALLLFAVMLTACEKKLQPVDVVIVDPVRHYYPVIQGEMMGVTYEVENISEHPLFIQEVQTSCGCLVPRDELPIVVLPHKSGFINLQFNTIKNTGYAHHHIYCYGNFADSSYIEMQFDTNVVPSADYNHDYEELWHSHHKAGITMRDYIESHSTQKGYYTEPAPEPRARERDYEEVRETANDRAF